ncbi:hypothetical protein L9F63_003416, partial [Diploptera punctata]
MNKSQDIEDPTCVLKLLNEFRSCNPRNPNILDNISSDLVATRFEFNDSLTTSDPAMNRSGLCVNRMDDDSLTEPSKKRKCHDNVITTPDKSSENASMEMSVAFSPWDVRRLKADLVQAKAHNTNLENQIKQYNALRKETEILFEKEKRSLLKEQDWDKEKIKSLENRMAVLKKREQESKNELSECRQAMEKNKFNLEKKILSLQTENTQLKDKIRELNFMSERNVSVDSKISALEAELTLSTEEIAALKGNTKSLEEKAVEFTHLRHQVELLEQQLAESKQKIKELENNLEDGKELRDHLEKQQENLKQFPELKREVLQLKEENKNLRDAVHNKLILEEEVMDLRARQAGFEEREQLLTKLQNTKELLEYKLRKWQKLAQDHCSGVPLEKVTTGPELLRIRIENLQQKELLLTSDMANLESRLKTIEHAKEIIDSELGKANKQIENLETHNQQKDILIKRLQKKFLLVSKERDSYRSQLDMYEKDLTLTSSPVLLTTQQQRSRIETLEKTVEGYRELVERLEGEQNKNSRVSGGNQILNERIQKLEEERDNLVKEKEELIKRRDELEIEMEVRALKGDFNPMKTKVLHFRMNPAAEIDTKRENEILKLRAECDKLRQRLKLIEEGQSEDLTQQVNVQVSTCSSQEIEELRNQVKSKDIKIQRLTEAFKASSKEYREVCYMLLGYRIDRKNSGLYHLSSMYAESPDEQLIFKITDGNIELLETPYSQTLEDLINLLMKRQHSIPAFLSTVTLDLFNRQT